MTDEAAEGRDQFLEKREPGLVAVPLVLLIDAFPQVRGLLSLMRGRCVARTAAAIPDAAARVLSSAVGQRWAYVLSVVVADAWPIARCTVTTSHPAAISPLAK